MKTPEKFTVRAIQPGEIEQVSAGVVRAFALQEDGVRWFAEEWCQRYPQRPGYTPETQRVGVLDGRVIAHVAVDSYTLRYGGARLRVAGISMVYTDAAYRGKGYAAAVLRDALTVAVEQQTHLAMLHGIRGYYTRFGFYPVFPHYFATFDAYEAAALAEQSTLTLREAQPDDIPVIAALYERHWGGRMTFTRSPEMWLWRVLRGDDNRRAWVVASSEDAPPQGYIAGRDLTGERVEVVANTPQAARTLLSLAGHLALEAGRETVRWLMPPDDAIIAFAQGVLPITLSAAYSPDGGWMARVIDTGRLTEVLLPELFAQARLALPSLTPEDLLLSSTAQGVTVGRRGTDAVQVVLSQRDFIQLLFGAVSAAALGLRDGLSWEQVRLLQAVFPPRVAALGEWDWF
jgi:predicted acetyltransferase